MEEKAKNHMTYVKLPIWVLTKKEIIFTNIGFYTITKMPLMKIKDNK